MDETNKLLARQSELVEQLNKAALLYYSGSGSIMSDKDYDELYDELERLEAETGIVLDESPTQRAGYEPQSKLAKVNHESPALSLSKTKDIDKLKSWFKKVTENAPSKEGVLSWKCDGLTLVATYLGGKLSTAVTRGDGYVGEDVTHNAPFIKGLPMTIPYTNKLIIRGEVVTSFSDFEKLKSIIVDEDARYKNARNLTSGSLRQYDPKIAALRKMQFRAFEYVVGDNILKLSTAFEKLEEMGFAVVEHRVVTMQNFDEVFNYFKEKVEFNDIPTDGLVLTVNDLPYGKLLGYAGKYSKSGMAFKWKDETADTTLRGIEWSASKTGLINPVAIFDTVIIDGTSVSRASVHNISVMKQLKLSLGSTVSVYKANMIIPQIDHCDSDEFTIPIPATCPICKSPTKTKTSESGTTTLWCTNELCNAKIIGRIERFASREGLDIQGISTAMIETLVNNNILSAPYDLLTLPNLPSGKEQISKLEGFGEKSYDNLMSAINHAKTTTLKQFICCLSIDGIGHDFANTIKLYFSTSDNAGENCTDCLSDLMSHTRDECIDKLAAIHGIGPITAKAFVDWYKTHKSDYDKIKQQLIITDDKITVRTTTADNKIAGKTFVITGSLTSYPNRTALSDEIVSYGGKVAGSVSAKTDYLINNDIESTSGKNKTAKELGIPVISEEDYKNMLPK